MWRNNLYAQGWGGGYGRRRRGWGGGPPWARGGPPPGPAPGPVAPAIQPIPPPPPGAIRVAVPTNDPNGLNALVAGVFARAPFITIIDISGSKPVNVNSIPNPYAYGGGGAGIGLAQWLLSSGVQVVLAPLLGPNVENILAQSGVRIIYVQPGTRVLDALKTNQLIT